MYGGSDLHTGKKAWANRGRNFHQLMTFATWIDDTAMNNGF